MSWCNGPLYGDNVTMSRYDKRVAAYGGTTFRDDVPTIRDDGSVGGGKEGKNGEDATSAPSGRTSYRSDLTGAAESMVAGGLVGVGFSVAGFTFRPRNGCTPNSATFSSRGP
jgi:hypothetical protein